ncbi:uncharacterized protein ARMOST_06824 [Armillaria ostoyae]|uniref:Uncharacterized protein n=1 Tax=Armillaria ostoyae TaxID=47428 RepID=A0A284R433_ARMOS|nr:uncharacterized protein ARMOST_06824 [Armillaria ostoyae]
MTTFPPELVEIIVHDIWHSKMPSYIRKTFMTACPRINRTWKAVYAPIVSQDMCITNLAFLDYLYDIAQFQKSIIYHDFIPRLTRTITCFVDLRACEREGAAKEVYCYLIALPNICGFDALFPHVPYISFRLVWIGIRQPSYVLSFGGIPIHVRYDRFLSPSHHCQHPGSWAHESLGWSKMLEKLRAVGVPEYFFCTTFFYPASYHETIRHGVRRIRQSTYIDETQLGSWDSRDINQHLWIASKGQHSLRCLSRLFYHWEFKHAQSHLPSVRHSTKERLTTLLERENLV